MYLIFHHLVFFAHCNPQRLIIHKPSFCAALSLNKVPPYLILAVCALAAPMSKSLGARAPLPRLAGVPFFQEAVALMFDSSGRLLSEPSLATAQCLVLLELHEIAASHSWTKHYRYFGESIHPHYLPITCETRLGSRLLIYVIMTLVHSPIISVIFPIFFPISPRSPIL